jgi:phosphoribosylformylglycinamidine synthase subunit PurL
MTVTEVNLALAIEHGLNEEEYNKILQLIGRTPNLVELGLFSVMWSEHCSYKSTRFHLKNLPTKADWVICGPGENAGVIDIGDGDAAIFKMESHNHPSFIEPYQGAATGVGGILRDVFTMGARPVCNLNSLRFGAIDHPKTKSLVSGVVAGIGGYGNCVGVPTVGGETSFHKSYNGNILVNAMNVGIAKTDKIFYSAATSIGSPVIYVGSKTGKDGIHGATMASAEFGDDGDDKKPTIQVGDPFTEKLLIEACMELMQHDAILAIQDMGAAGLTSSSLEMAGKGGTGIELELSQVPLREADMTPYEIMLSESQERMLMVINPAKEDLARSIFNKWELEFAIIGVITNSGRVVLKMHNEIIADLPLAPLADEAPIYERPYKIINHEDEVDFTKFDHPQDYNATLSKLLASPDLCSRKWIWEQYDQLVMNDTIISCGGDAAVVRVHETNKAIAVTSDCTPRYCYANPIEGGKQAVVETWRNITATGAKPLAITNCLNFGNPQKPEIMGQIVGCLEGMSEACIALNYPIVSGNVSLYNETSGNAILPTPNIGGVGLMDDVAKACNIKFKNSDDVIIVIGQTNGHLGQSIYAREILGIEKGYAPRVDLDLEKRNGDFVRELIANSQVTACHDIADGGLYVAIAEMAIYSNLGCDLSVVKEDITGFLFGEDQARYIITTNRENLHEIYEISKKHHVIIEELGKVTNSNNLTLNGKSVTIEELKDGYEKTIQNYIA